MIDIIFRVLFLLFSVFFLVKCVFYAFYEINSEKNKIGGITVICFSILVTIFANVIVLIR